MANLTITLDDEDKKNILRIIGFLGSCVSFVFCIFKQTRKTIRAMKEGDKLIEKYKKDPNSVKTYNNVDELMEAMLK